MRTLKELRLAKGITLRGLADRLDLKDATKKGYISSLHRLEGGTQVPTITRIEAVLDALGYGIEVYAIDGDERIPIRFTHSRAKDAGKE